MKTEMSPFSQQPSILRWLVTNGKAVCPKPVKLLFVTKRNFYMSEILFLIQDTELELNFTLFCCACYLVKTRIVGQQ